MGSEQESVLRLVCRGNARQHSRETPSLPRLAAAEKRSGARGRARLLEPPARNPRALSRGYRTRGGSETSSHVCSRRETGTRASTAASAPTTQPGKWLDARGICPGSLGSCRHVAPARSRVEAPKRRTRGSV